MLQETILAEEPRFLERAIRTVTVLINAGITQGDRDGLCRIRNVSEGGLTIETGVSLQVGEPAEVMLHTGKILPCVIRWVNGRQAGMSSAVDPSALVGAPRPVEAGPTLPRFSRVIDVEIVAVGIAYRCTLDSISTRDILATNVPVNLCAGQIFSVCIDGLGTLPASVQIAEDGDLFARFAPAISFATLDAWLVRSQLN